MTLESARTALGAVGSQLDALGAAHDGELTDTGARLAEALAKKGYATSAALLKFEAAFGGLLVPTETSEDWHTQGMYLLVGVFACVTSDAHVRPLGGPANAALGLVPIVYDPTDGILFLDGQGRAYFQDTIEDVDATLFADDGVVAIARMLATLPDD